MAMCPEAKPRLVAVVVTYNRLTKLQLTVDRLLAEPCDLIYVVDNGSSDGSRDWLNAHSSPRLRAILTPQNLGGAGGFELGLRHVVEESDPDWCVIMDDDARPVPGCFSKFLAEDRQDWDAVAGAVYLKDGRICELNRPTVNPFWNTHSFLKTILATLIGRGRRGFHISDAAYKGGPRSIDASSFVGLFLSRHAVSRGGFPDGGLFIYGDDVLYTLSLRMAGLKLGFLPAMRFEHDHEAGSLARQRCTPIWKAYYAIRNGILVYRFAAGYLFWPAMAPIFVRWLADGWRYGSDRPAYNRLLWAGLKDGLAGNRSRPHAQVAALAAGGQDDPAA